MKRTLMLLLCLGTWLSGQAQQIVQDRVYRTRNTRTVINAATLTSLGNVLFSGNYTVTSGGYRHEFMLVKPDTDTLWTRRGVLLATGSHEIKEKPGGGFVLFGTMPNIPPPTNRGDLYFQGFSANGSHRWQKTYNFNTYETGHLVQIAPDSGYFAGGQGGVPGKPSPFSLLRTDSLGNIKWQKDYSWFYADGFIDMKYTASGNLILAGFTSDSSIRRRLKLLEINQNGDSILGNMLPSFNAIQGEYMEYTYGSVTPLTDGGFLLTAKIDTVVNGLTKVMGMVVKTDANLQPVWRYIKQNYQASLTFTKARELADGSVLVMAFHYPTATNTFYFYRFSPAGALLNVYPFSSTLATEVRAVTLDVLPDTSFIIGGEATVTPFPNLISGMYVAKVKVAGLPPVVPPFTITGLNPGGTLPKAALGQSYPNPAQTEVTIPYVVPANAREAYVEILELVTGRKVKQVELKERGQQLVQVSLTNLKSGLYAYSLIVDGKRIETKKLVVLK